MRVENKIVQCTTNQTVHRPSMSEASKPIFITETVQRCSYSVIQHWRSRYWAAAARCDRISEARSVDDSEKWRCI